MNKLLILLSLFYSLNSQAEIVRNQVVVSNKQIQEAKQEITNQSLKETNFNDSTGERLRVFNEQGAKELNNSGNGQFVDIRIPLIWYVHVF